MKKLLTLIIALLCVVTLVSCTTKESTTTTKKDDVTTTTKSADITTTKNDDVTTTTNDDDVTTTSGEGGEDLPEGVKPNIDSSKTVSSIKVEVEPTHKYYLINGTFDPTGGVVEVKYSDKTTDLVDMASSDFTFDYNFNAAMTKQVSIICGKKSVKISVYVKSTSFNVTYDENYNNAPQPRVESVVQGDSARPQTPEREGYTFVAWYGNADFQYTYDFKESVLENLTLYALWTKDGIDHYDVTFNKGYYGDIYETYTYTSDAGSPIVKPSDPTRFGYTFDKWVDENNVPYDFSTPLSGNKSLTATWVKAISGTKKYLFEAEDTSLAKKVGPAFSGTCSEEGMIVTAPADRNCSGGYFVSYLYREENSLEFFVVSDEDTTITLYARFSAELRDYTFDPSNFEINVNGTPIDYSPMVFANVPFDTENFSEGADALDCLPFQDFLVGSNIPLRKGQNLIQIVTKNSVPMEGTTLEAAAPIVDAMVVETTSVLQWDHTRGLPVLSNYSPRPTDEYWDAASYNSWVANYIICK